MNIALINCHILQQNTNWSTMTNILNLLLFYVEFRNRHYFYVNFLTHSIFISLLISLTKIINESSPAKANANLTLTCLLKGQLKFELKR